MKKVAIYVDGSNFYFSLKKKFTTKIDVEKFCKKLAGENNLMKINYYIAPVDRIVDPNRYAIQQRFIAKLKKVDKLNIVFGRLEKRRF